MSDVAGYEKMSEKSEQKDECRDYQRGACQRGQKCKYIHVDCALKPGYRELFVDNLVAETLAGIASKFSKLDTIEGMNKSGCLSRKTCGYQCIKKGGKHILNDGNVLSAEESCKKLKLGGETKDINRASNYSSNNSSKLEMYATERSSCNASDPYSLTSSRCKPICKDFLKGRCTRSICCKYRHMTLDEFEEETFERAAIHVVDRLLAMIEHISH